MFLFSRFTLGLVCAAALPASALAQFSTPAPQAVIIDYDSGEVLFEKDARRPMPPASMTKIMTAQMVFEALRDGDLTEETEFNVSEEAWRRGGVKSGSSTMFLKLGSSVSVIDLLRGVIIQSGNDACIVLAEGMSGSEDAFAMEMTDRAHELGLSSATFRNSTGWPDDGHEISALDLAKLAQIQISEFPDRYPIYAERSFTWNSISQDNRNPLLGKMTGADGLKTGHTEVSGYGVVGSALRGGKRRIIVINGLGSKSERAEVSLSLMKAAFDQFDVYTVYEAGAELGEVDIFMGKAETVPVTLGEKVQLGLHRTARKDVSAEMTFKTVVAPVTKGDEVAVLTVTAPGQEPRTYPVYAAADVARKGALSRAWTALVGKIRG